MPRLIPRLFARLGDLGTRTEVIVVDDASPDGTAQRARELSETYPIRVIERHDVRGLASAVLAGFAHAQGAVCVVMDADGSHPVEAVPPLVDGVLSGRADIAVGSRLATGGGFGGAQLWEKAKSRFAAFFARGLTSLSDPTSGFMAVRRELVDELELDPIGWKIVLEVVVKAAPRPFVEVPIVFGPRVAGTSKQSPRVFWQYLRHLHRLRMWRKGRA